MVEVDPDWWRTWFGPSYLALYDEYLQERTPGEVDQLEALLHLEPPLRILDLPCGHGRHAIELARRGYDVTGIDLSPSMLEVARKRALTAGVSVRFLEGDMREPIGEPAFDLVLNLFTSLGYFSDPADDRRVAESAAAALKPKGRLLVEVINGERVMMNFQEREWFPVGDATVLERRSLDRASRRMTVQRTVHRKGHDEVNHHVVRLYGATELVSLLKAASFMRIELYGDWDGSTATPESLRVLAVASRA
ncbi:MAG TPA: class I SAM-dependent methyltransferase [Candidatus Dormibacteraeota bacterium]